MLVDDHEVMVNQMPMTDEQQDTENGPMVAGPHNMMISRRIVLNDITNHVTMASDSSRILHQEPGTPRASSTTEISTPKATDATTVDTTTTTTRRCTESTVPLLKLLRSGLGMPPVPAGGASVSDLGVHAGTRLVTTSAIADHHDSILCTPKDSFLNTATTAPPLPRLLLYGNRHHAAPITAPRRVFLPLLPEDQQELPRLVLFHNNSTHPSPSSARLPGRVVVPVLEDWEDSSWEDYDSPTATKESDSTDEEAQAMATTMTPTPAAATTTTTRRRRMATTRLPAPKRSKVLCSHPSM